ncbi:MAG: Rpn family recombination-promoting nuclease/putative transposase [Bacteroidota bacterium]
MSTSNPNRIIQLPKKVIYKPHDAYGKDSLSHTEIIADCLKARLNKKLVKRLDFNTLTFVSTEFIIGVQLIHCQSDIICRVSIDKTDVVYFIIELQSTPDKYMADRLDEYTVLLARSHQTAEQTLVRPFIVPVCMYNGQTPYPYSTYLYDCIAYPELAQEYGVLYRFELWDLTQSTIDELLEQGGKSGLFQALLKQAKCGEFIEVLQKVTPEYIQQLPRRHVQSSAMYIYHKSKPEQGEECLRLLSELIQEKTVKEEVMSYADSIHYKGVEKGKQLGMELGIQEGVTRGKQESMLQAAKTLLHQGVEMGTISLATGLQREQLLQLR